MMQFLLQISVIQNKLQVEIKEFRIVKHEKTLIEEVAVQVAQMGIKSLGFEKEDVTYSGFELYKQAIKADLVPLAGLVEKIRLIKTDEEISIIKAACRIADEAYEHIVTYIKPGMTELRSIQ